VTARASGYNVFWRTHQNKQTRTSLWCRVVTLHSYDSSSIATVENNFLILSEFESNTLLALRFSHSRVKFWTMDLSRSTNYRFCAVAIPRALKTPNDTRSEYVFYLFIKHCFLIVLIVLASEFAGNTRLLYSDLVMKKIDNYQLANYISLKIPSCIQDRQNISVITL